jgi:hypothetical protein
MLEIYESSSQKVEIVNTTVYSAVIAFFPIFTFLEFRLAGEQKLCGCVVYPVISKTSISLTWKFTEPVKTTNLSSLVLLV